MNIDACIHTKMDNFLYEALERSSNENKKGQKNKELRSWICRTKQVRSLSMNYLLYITQRTLFLLNYPISYSLNLWGRNVNFQLPVLPIHLSRELDLSIKVISR